MATPAGRNRFYDPWLWAFALVWCVLAGWAIRTMVTVAGLRDLVEERVGWVGDAQEARSAIERELRRYHVLSTEGTPVAAAAVLAEVAGAARRQGELAAAAPVPDENERERMDQVARDSALLARRALQLAEPSQASGGAAESLAELEELRANTSLGITALVQEVRRGLAVASVELGHYWSVLYAFAGLNLVIAGALGVALARMRRQARLLVASARALQAGEERYRSLVDAAQSAIWTADRDGRLTFVSGAARQVFGRRPEELVGRPFWELLAPEVRNAERTAYRQVSRGEAVRSHETVHLKGGDRHGRLIVNSVPLRDADGAVVGAIGTAADVTETAELREALERQERLESVRTLAGGVAHDFNNMLAAVMGHADLARLSCAEGSPEARHLRTIVEVCERARGITGQLLTFARHHEVTAEVIDLRQPVADLKPVLERLLGPARELVVDLPDEPVWVEADGGRIEQVLVNLVANARDALPEGGRISVSVRRRTLHSDGEDGATEYRGRAVLSVEDDGEGMPQEVRERAFDPFFTTKPPGTASGLGLAVVHGIVLQHGGTLDVRSAPGEGTRVDVVLRASDPPRPQAPVVDAAPPPRLPGRRLLVVEDENLVREIMAESLRVAGAEVLEASDAQQALDLVADGAARLDALVTDVRMPGVSGPQLAARLRLQHPDLPVIFISGYSGDDLPVLWRDKPGVSFLSKPFKPRALLDALVRVMAGKD